MIAAGVEFAYIGFATYGSIGFGANWYSNIWVGILGAYVAKSRVKDNNCITYSIKSSHENKTYYRTVINVINRSLCLIDRR